MEAAIRWSTQSTLDRQTFLIADVAENRLRHCVVTGAEGQKIEYRQIAGKDKVPNYTAFDWNRSNEQFVATGDGFGTTRLVRLDTVDEGSSDYLQTFRIRQERKCNSLSFSGNNLLASAYDKARTDASLNVYDLNGASNAEPLRKLANADNGKATTINLTVESCPAAKELHVPQARLEFRHFMPPDIAQPSLRKSLRTLLIECFSSCKCQVFHPRPGSAACRDISAQTRRFLEGI